MRLRHNSVHLFSSLGPPDGSAPAALASLLFDLPEPKTIGKTQWAATFLPCRAPGSSFFWLSLLWSSSLLFSSLLFSSLALPTSSFYLSMLSIVWRVDFLRLYWSILFCAMRPAGCTHHRAAVALLEISFSSSRNHSALASRFFQGIIEEGSPRFEHQGHFRRGVKRFQN